MLARLTASVTRVRWQLTILVSSVTVLSALVTNIGALAILIPSALRMARTSGAPPSAILMPKSFGFLLGGLMTLGGTYPDRKSAVSGTSVLARVVLGGRRIMNSKLEGNTQRRSMM